MHLLIQDLSISIRSLRRSPGFTLVAVLTLALGISGTTAVFTLISATLLRPLPYPDPHRVFILRWQDHSDISGPAFLLIKNRVHSFSSLTALSPVNAGVNISATGQPQYVKALPVSKDFFKTLGILPAVGATFSAEEDQPHALPATVLSYRLWVQQFNRDPSVLGRELQVNGTSHKIIGIMPSEFRSYPEADIWLPLQLTADNTDVGSNFRVIGRLATPISQQQAQYELDQLAREYHSTYPWSASQGTIVTSDLQSFLSDKLWGGLTLLFAAVAFVFLIACINVAILILVRATERSRPIAVRVALGSTRPRLMFSLFAESLLLSCTGGLLGLILAKESIPLFLWLWPASFPLAGSNVAIDWRVVLFTLAGSVLSSLLVSILPGLKLSRINIAQALARTSGRMSAVAEQVRTVHYLVFGQMVLTVILMAGTMLLATSLAKLYSVPLGFDPNHVVVAQVSLAGQRYGTTASTDRLLDQAVRRVQALPDVEAVATVNGLPLDNGLNLPLHPLEMPAAIAHADEYRPVSPDYFKVLQVPLRSGRLFLPTDIAGSQPVAIINETMARRWWPNTSALGHYVRVDEKLGPQPPDVPREIVGVIADTHEKGPGEAPPAAIFVPLKQVPDNITAFCNKVFLTSIIVRTSHRIDLSAQVRSAIQSVDPTLPLASFQPFSHYLDKSLVAPRFLTFLTLMFGGFALLLTAVGIHGLLNYQVRLRTREIAVRMAIGATRIRIVRMVVQHGTRLIFFAVLLGLACSFLVKSLLSHLLYNMGSSSLIVIFGTGLLLASIATLLNLLSAIRAASIEPMAVLRNE